ncbi:MAG: FAD-dependent oxidoreductase [Alphaproteobacteria bacterium]|nr:FAD-dependent oxidoreductase [Alphaproteobacteria bacterium]
MTDSVDTIVVGAGVVGLAIARALALSGREVVVLEAANAIGTGTSSRNSEVIHAGIYYPRGSLKAIHCVAGRERLYTYCAEKGVPHRRCGKLIVATDNAQVDGLRALEQKSRANGVADVRWLDANVARTLEPALHCVAALLSPSTGIIDSHGLMLAYRGDAEDAGAMIAFRSPFESATVTADGILVEVGGDEPTTVLARQVVNSAGLFAQPVAQSIRGLDPATVPPRHFAKGNYFSLAGRAPFTHLIYPAPEQAGLGVHLTLDLAGQGKFGPDVEWIDVAARPEDLDYAVDPARCAGFYAAVRTYWPDLRDDSLQPAYSGIRPKIQAPGETAADFVIQGPDVHGVRGLVNLYGIESPGLTASLSLADAVVACLDGGA